MGAMMAQWPKVKLPVVDIRDVATCHLEGLKRPEAANQRFICAWGAAWGPDMHKPLLKNYDNCGYKIQKGSTGKMMLKFAGMFDPMSKAMADSYDVDIDFENKETKECLGVDFIHYEKSIDDMALSLIEIGYIPDRRNEKKKMCF